MVAVLVIPGWVILPGVAVTVHGPGKGKPLNTTLPVAVRQVGWIVLLITGAAGVTGAALIVTLLDVEETQPAALVTVQL